MEITMENTFKKPEELIEWVAVTHGVILAFEQRGYGLYKLGRGPMMFSDIEMIMEFVQYGRTEDVLEIGYRYLPLPLLKDSKDHNQMRKAIEEMVKQIRGPFFIDVGTNSEGKPEMLGRHLIDTIGVYPPFLHLGTDVNFAQITTENTIVLHLSSAADIIKKQLMMSLRQVSLYGQGRKPDALL
jgi:hypothetical protein